MQFQRTPWLNDPRSTGFSHDKLLDMPPRFIQTYTRHALCAQLKLLTQSFLRFPCRYSPSYLSHVTFRNLCVRIFRASRNLYQAYRVSMSDILTSRAPLKVLNTIISLIPVFMVHVVTAISPRNKRKSHKPMHKMQEHFLLYFKRDLVIPMTIHTQSEKSPLMRSFSLFWMRPNPTQLINRIKAFIPGNGFHIYSIV